MAQGKQRESREAAARLKRYEARQQMYANQNRRRVRDNIIAVVGVLVVVGAAAVAQVQAYEVGPLAPTPTPSATAGETPAAGENVGAPPVALAADRVWDGSFTFNDATEVGISLDGTLAPQAVAGFIQDLGTGYYPGKTCHRLGADLSFLQCGSIDGVGGPDPAFSYGPVENAPADAVYPAGTIAMARQGDNGYSNGHQFFIVLSETSFPADSAGGYTVVGSVTSGLEALQALVADGVDPAAASPTDGSGAPLSPVTISGFRLQ